MKKVLALVLLCVFTLVGCSSMNLPLSKRPSKQVGFKSPPAQNVNTALQAHH